MMNFLPLCKAIIQHQRMSKSGYGFGAKNNRKVDDMCHKKIVSLVLVCTLAIGNGYPISVNLPVCAMACRTDFACWEVSQTLLKILSLPTTPHKAFLTEF